MTDASIWGTRMRLKGGHLAHWAGPDRQGSARLAHGDCAWTDTLLPAPDDAPECPRCARKLPGLERMVERLIEEGVLLPR